MPDLFNIKFHGLDVDNWRLMFQVPENSPVGTVVGNLSVYDPDNLHLPLQKFHCLVMGGAPFKVSL